MHKKVLLLSFVLFSLLMNVQADNNMQRINVNLNNISLKDFFSYIEKNYPYTFMYNNTEINDKEKISVKEQNQTINNVLNAVLGKKGIKYEIEGDQVILTKGNHLSVTSPSSTQQNRTLTGLITDKNGEPIIGANVVVKGTTIGMISDLNGGFTLNNVPANATLQVSFIGYLTQEIKVGNRNSFSVTLQEDTQSLEDVVVVGYGTQKKANLTGAVSTVSLPEMEKRTVASTSLALQGLVPGVTVTQRSGKPGGDGGVISVRGKTTLGNNDVLVLIDGVESNINSIDPKSIESISVLKDAASAAIYGSRAANGVILITTKRAEDGKAICIL